MLLTGIGSPARSKAVRSAAQFCRIRGGNSKITAASCALIFPGPHPSQLRIRTTTPAPYARRPWERGASHGPHDPSGGWGKRLDPTLVRSGPRSKAGKPAARRGCRHGDRGFRPGTLAQPADTAAHKAAARAGPPPAHTSSARLLLSSTLPSWSCRGQRGSREHGAGLAEPPPTNSPRARSSSAPPGKESLERRESGELSQSLLSAAFREKAPELEIS